MMEQTKNWIRERERGILFVLFIILIATASFAAGYLVAKEDVKAPIVIEKGD